LRNRIVYLAAVLVLLAGCGDSKAIKELVQAQLRDPESARFDELVFSEDGNQACVEWNAKNGYGGYGSPKIAELKKTDGAWEVVTMEGHRLNCTATAFKAIKAAEHAAISAEIDARERLKAQGKFRTPDEESDAARHAGPCGMLLWAVGHHTKQTVEAEVRGDDRVELHRKFLTDTLAKVDAGDCTTK